MKTFFILSLSFLFVVTCDKKSNEKIEINLEKEIQAILSKEFKKDTTINLCETFSSFDWDSLAVLKPYTSYNKVEEIGLNGIHSLKRQIEVLSSTDFNCLLLFIKDNSVVRYSVVPRAIDFSSISEHQISIVSVLDCNVRLYKSGDHYYLKKD
jgi:hypothetical protein